MSTYGMDFIYTAAIFRWSLLERRPFCDIFTQ